MKLTLAFGKRHPVVRAILLLCGSLLAVGVASTAGLGWLQWLTPTFVVCSGLLCLKTIYLWQRSASFKKREARRIIDPAEIIAIPEDVKKPRDYDGGHCLYEGQWKYIERAVASQGQYFAGGTLAAVLSPLALLLLSLQLLAAPAGGSWALGLIAAEIFCLGTLIYIAWTNREPTEAWIGNRLRTELLRREQFLVVAGVGPYLNKNSSASAETARQRRTEIERTDFHNLLELGSLQNHSAAPTWMEDLYRTPLNSTVSAADCIGRMNTYFHHRIQKQLGYFANELRDCHENERLWSKLLTAGLLAAVLAAILHAVHLYVATRSNLAITESSSEHLWHILVGVMAVVLPPLGTAALSIRAMYNFGRRSRLYGRERRALLAYRSELEGLIREAELAKQKTALRSIDKIDLDFRAIVLRTEQSLSVEMEQWVFLMEKPEHELSP
jgi:hypothetical protein